MNRIRYGLFTAALFFALVLSALNVAPALADESEPPVETATEEAPPAEEVSEETQPAATEEEATPTQVETDSVSEEESTTVAEVIESLPEDTTLVVLDENGEALPLASAEAQEIIYSGDPIWCPAGVAPNPNVGGCSPTFTSFTNDTNPDLGLIDWLYNVATPAGVSKAGTIWVAYNYAPAGGETGAIVINGTLVQGTMENFALTIQGGWNGTNGSKLLDTTTPYSTFYVPFSIISWTGAVTINNIMISGATGVGVQALNVVTAGNITVNNVDVVSNTTQFSGAELSNVSGTGNVVVNDSTFNNNTGSVNSGGLSILSNGTVTLKNVTANGNSLYGVNISNTKAVTLNGTNHFSYNGEIGLNIGTQGVITLNNITAMGNASNGAWLDNCDYNTGTFLCNFGVSSAVTIKGTNNFSDNGWDGLRVYSGGVITVSNITANGNGTDPARSIASAELYDAFGKGALLHNYGALTAKNIIISGTNVFNGNASNGLTAISYGMITVNNITASENNCDPLFDTDTSYCAGAYLDATAGITQTGYGRFSDNEEDGLLAINYYKGAITLNNLFAENNGAVGVFAISSSSGITPVNVTVNGVNTFTNNLDSGLAIDTDGTVTLNNLTANYNGSDGVYVNNAYIVKAVNIKGINTFNNNTFSGLYVESYGAITTNSITALYNAGGSGVYLDNCEEDGFGACLSLSAQPVTMNGINVANENVDGVLILSRGAITVNSITANYNAGIGVLFGNQYNNAVGGITMKGYGTFTGNLLYSGLNAFSNGSITMANLTSNDNNTYGAVIGAGPYPVGGNVTLTGLNIFNNNGSGGLAINNLGVVLLNNITANDNGFAGGVFIDNSTGTLAKAVTLNGNNTFNNNVGTGLEISSLGAIKINNVMANYNSDVTSNGAFLNNDFTIQNQPITLTGYGIFNGNGNVGLGAYSNGNITLANITANSNVNRGVDIDTQNNLIATSTATVTITGINTFNDNGERGLSVFSDGAITLSNITANDNANMGAYLDNVAYASGSVKNLTINGVNMFSGNNADGLRFNITGAVTMTRITANYNDDGAGNGSGIYGDAGGNITLTCGSMYSNADYGYTLFAGIGKVITLKGVFTYGNGLGNFPSPTPVITRTCPLP